MGISDFLGKANDFLKDFNGHVEKTYKRKLATLSDSELLELSFRVENDKIRALVEEELRKRDLS